MGCDSNSKGKDPQKSMRARHGPVAPWECGRALVCCRHGVVRPAPSVIIPSVRLSVCSVCGRKIEYHTNSNKQYIYRSAERDGGGATGGRAPGPVSNREEEEEERD